MILTLTQHLNETESHVRPRNSEVTAYRSDLLSAMAGSVHERKTRGKEGMGVSERERVRPTLRRYSNCLA